MSLSTVVIRLAAPMQSWASLPRGAKIRPTGDHPTKRGVIGLVANAMGRDWSDDVSDLAGLRFAVRADRIGRIESDYQTAGGGKYLLLPGEVMANPKWRKAAAKRDPNTPGFGADYLPPRDITAGKDGAVAAVNNPSLTDVHYIADAVFTVALSGDSELVERVADALGNPARAVFLGRKAYLPTDELLAGIIEDADDPAQVLAEFAWHERAVGQQVPVWAEVDPGTAGARVVTDQPIDYHTRRAVGRAELCTHIPGPGSSGGKSDAVREVAHTLIGSHSPAPEVVFGGTAGDLDFFDND